MFRFNWLESDEFVPNGKVLPRANNRFNALSITVAKCPSELITMRGRFALQ